MQINVSLTPELYEFVQRKVQSGLYGNAREVVRDALRRMDKRGIVDAAWSELNDTLEASVASGQRHKMREMIRQTLFSVTGIKGMWRYPRPPTLKEAQSKAH